MARRTRKPAETNRVCTLLERHGCPVPFHTVRTLFLGNIATPLLQASPLQVVEGLWGGALPVFDSQADAEALIDALVRGLWNDLTRHQKRSQPFHLTRMPMEPDAASLRRFADVRLEEIDGFIDGLFAEEEEIELPERAHVAVEALGDMRAMLAGIHGLLDRDPAADDSARTESMLRGVRDLNRIMEVEINEAVLSCTRARRQMLDGIPTTNPTIH